MHPNVFLNQHNFILNFVKILIFPKEKKTNAVKASESLLLSLIFFFETRLSVACSSLLAVFLVGKKNKKTIKPIKSLQMGLKMWKSSSCARGRKSGTEKLPNGTRGDEINTSYAGCYGNNVSEQFWCFFSSINTLNANCF